MAKKTPLSYEQAGVSINANDDMVRRISRSLKSTHGPRVIALENGFAGLFRLDYDEKLFKKNYKTPVLVACTDGIGTKVLVAQQAGRFGTLGIDLVAMSVNDMIVQGAEPLFFLDYLAIHKLEPAVVAEMVESVAAGCRMADCALIGGETAEMPDIYAEGEYDLAGFAVGVVERNRVITGKAVRPGDVVLGLASSGLHSNGYTLVRHICFKKEKLDLHSTFKEFDGATLGAVCWHRRGFMFGPSWPLLEQLQAAKRLSTVYPYHRWSAIFPGAKRAIAMRCCKCQHGPSRLF